MRVLQVIRKMDRAGAESAIMNWYRQQDRDDIQFDFMVADPEPGAFEPEISELGGRVYRVQPFTGLNGMSYRKEVRRLLEDHPEWEIVHGHLGSSASRYLKEARSQGRIAIAHSHNTWGPLTPEEILFRGLAIPVRVVAQDFIGCSDQAGLDRFGQKIFHGPHYATLANGVDIERYANSEERHQAAKEAQGWQGRTVVGNVSRLTAQKNHPFLLQAFKEYLALDPTALLVLVGKGEDWEALEAMARELGIDGSVVFFGPTSDVPSVLKAFDIFVMPSLYEGLPVASVEAQAAGVPLLISDGVPKEALLVPQATQKALAEGPEAWARTMRALVERGPYWQSGPQDVRKAGFDVRESAAWLASHYHELQEKQRLGLL